MHFQIFVFFSFDILIDRFFYLERVIDVLPSCFIAFPGNFHRPMFEIEIEKCDEQNASIQEIALSHYVCDVTHLE